MFVQFEMVFPRVLDAMYGGSTLNRALRDLPGEYAEIDIGAFTRWVVKDATRHSLYKEAKVIRTEAWTGKMVEYALGDEAKPVDIDRSKHIVDTFKWLIARENRGGYGETKTIEVNQNISITDALSAAKSRVSQLNTIDVDLITEGEYRQLTSVDDEGDDT